MRKKADKQLNSLKSTFKSRSVYNAEQGCCSFSLWMKPLYVTIQMKVTKQFFHVVLFILLRKMEFQSVDKTLVCDHSIKSC